MERRASHSYDRTDGPGERSHGRKAEWPQEIPKKGWWDIAIRVKKRISNTNLSVLAAGVGFYALLSVVPGLVALISIYGLMADPIDVENLFASFQSVMPGEVHTLLKDQITRISANSHAAGWGLLLGLVLALWSGSAATKALMQALNVAYHEDEKRGFIRFNAIALGLTLAGVASVLVSLGLIAGIPAALKFIGLESFAKTLINILRWPLLLALAMTSLAVLYRYAPSREEPKWRWVTWGAVLATLLWVGGSALFSLYVSHFGNYNKTYGSLGAIVVVLLWLYLTGFAILLGAQINAEMEHQTAKDSTTGRPKPMGNRGAYVADTVGEKSDEHDEEKEKREERNSR